MDRLPYRGPCASCRNEPCRSAVHTSDASGSSQPRSAYYARPPYRASCGSNRTVPFLPGKLSFRCSHRSGDRWEVQWGGKKTTEKQSGCGICHFGHGVNTTPVSPFHVGVGGISKQKKTKQTSEGRLNTTGGARAR